MRAATVLLGAVMLGGVLFGATAASGANPPMMGGAIQLWVTPSENGNGSGGHVLITGAIADYGTTQSVNAAGKPLATQSVYKELEAHEGDSTDRPGEIRKGSEQCQPDNVQQVKLLRVRRCVRANLDPERHGSLCRDHGYRDAPRRKWSTITWSRHSALWALRNRILPEGRRLVVA